jgi:hypothetical protein
MQISISLSVDSLEEIELPVVDGVQLPGPADVGLLPRTGRDGPAYYDLSSLLQEMFTEFPELQSAPESSTSAHTTEEGTEDVTQEL